MKRHSFVILFLLLVFIILHSRESPSYSYCSSYDVESCPSPECKIETKEISILRCESGSKQVEVCVENPDYDATTEKTFCYPSGVYGLIPSADSSVEIPARFKYEGVSTADIWKFKVEEDGAEILIPSTLTIGEDTIRIPVYYTISGLANEHCNYYTFSYQRPALTLTFRLPLIDESICEYSTQPILDDFESILALGGRLPDGIQKAIISRSYGILKINLEDFCSEVIVEPVGGNCNTEAICKIEVTQGPKEYFAYSFKKDSCGNRLVDEENSGRPIDTLTRRTEEIDFISFCSENYYGIQCEDGIDNDNDGKTDYPYDPSCYSSKYYSEFEKTYDKCMELYPGTNDPNSYNRINVIFIGHGYEGLGEFFDTIVWQVDNMLELKPFKTHKDKFNFWVVGEIGDIENCEDRLAIPPFEVSNYLHCPTDLADKCRHHAKNNKFVNNIINDLAIDIDYRARALYFIDGSLMMYQTDIDEYNNAEKYFAHEFGHTFGLLHDEYIEKSFPEFFKNFPNLIPLNGPNCYSTVEDTTYDQCWQNAPWKDMFGDGCGEPGIIDCDESDPDYIYEVGCYEGCFYFSHGAFRPTRCNIMGEIRDCPDTHYGPVNEKQIEKRIFELTES